MTIACPTVHSALPHIVRAKPRLIGIDGLDGCRKTTIARELAGHTHHKVISVDEFVNRNKGTYVDHINYDDLRSAILNQSTILEGICLLRVVERIGLPLDLAIYVEKRHHGIWEGKDCLGLDQHADAFLRKLGKDPESIEDLYSELIHYHHHYRPHEKADLTFYWDGGSSS